MVHPIILLAVLVAGLVICFGSRKRALTSFLAAALLIPTDQVLLLGALHFPMLRVLIIFGAVRLIREKISGARLLGAGWNRIDLAMTVLTIATAIDGILLWPQSASVVFQLGNLYSAFGAYFVLRFLIRDEDDVLSAIRTLAYISLFVAAIMSYEQATGKNPYYAYLGGAHASMYGTSIERDDRFRATGCFGHPNLAGAFGASSLPLFVGLWWREKKNRNVAALGAAATAIIAVASGSSTALLGFGGGILALLFWPMRRWMRPVRWSIVAILVSLHMVMKAPVWHLISRIDLAGGSSSYHRYALINQCIIHFSDWWLMGTKSYADWGWDMWDLSNQYVWTADTAGLIPLLAFLATIIYGFKYVGKARRVTFGDRRRELLIWALGSSLFANVVAFFGISYFDQMIVAWYALICMIPIASSLIWQVARERKARAGQSEVPEVPMIEDSPVGTGPLIDYQHQPQLGCAYARGGVR
jgi:hypothetical protein